MVICQPGVEEVLRKGGGLEEGRGLLKIILGGVIDSGPCLEKLTCKIKWVKDEPRYHMKCGELCFGHHFQ